MSNSNTRILESENVYLRPVEQEDMERMYEAQQNAEIRRLTGSKDVFSRDDIDQYYERIRSDENRVDFAICLKGTEEAIGDITLMNISQSDRNGITRIAINEQTHFGQGYGTEAMNLMLDFAFGNLNLHRVQLDVISYNERAIKSYEKAGFKVEGRIRDELYYDFKYHDSIIMGILEDEYKKLRGN